MNVSSRSGLLGSAARLGISVAGLAELRLKLFAGELESERLWLARLALRLAITLLAMTLACGFLGAWLAWLLWDWNHALALLAPAVLFGAMGALCWNALLAMNAAKPPAFTRTRAEFARDIEALGAFCASDRD